MGHPTDGVLRRFLDEPAGVIDADRAHVTTCAECQQALATVRADAEAAAAVLALPPDDPPDVSAAHRRLVAALAEPATRRTRPVGSVRPRSRRGIRRPAVAGAAVALVLAGASAAAAAGWIPILRTERVEPVAITTQDLMDLPDLQAYGEVEVLSDPIDYEVADAALAAERTGLAVPVVDELPDGVTGEPTLRVITPLEIAFTFSTEEAESAARRAGERMPPGSDDLDGTRVRLSAGPGLASVWTSRSEVPALVVARVVAPTAVSDRGIPFRALRDHLLSIPGFPEGLADSLRRIDADGTTLPLPVPADRFDTSEVTVDGHPATLLTLRGGGAAAVTWVDDEVIHLAGGTLEPDEVLAVARSLR